MASTPHAERRLRFTIPPDQAGRTLLAFLLARFPFFPQAEWISRITRQRLVINGASATPETLLQTGNLIEYLDWDIPEPAVDKGYSVVHEDADFLAVNKPAGLPCHPGGRYLHNSLTLLLQKRHGLETPILVNRLDRETSGLVLVARNRRAAKALQQQFAKRQVEKRYTAFVEGDFQGEVHAVGWIVPDTESVVRKRRLFIAGSPDDATLGAIPEAEHAVTHLIGKRSGGGLSEVEARPATGRTHQIRATLLALGYPIVGDKLYGRDAGLFLRFCNGTLSAEDHAVLRMNRQALHAGWLQFRHPSTRKVMEVKAPLPEDLKPLLKLMGASPQRDLPLRRGE